jgi:peptidoglycan/xylan/chitin deacetylase (PgdA/CDA1 family)
MAGKIGSYQVQHHAQVNGANGRHPSGSATGAAAAQVMGTSRMPLIAMYHSVEPYRQDPYLVTVSPERFEQQLDWLSARGLRGVSVSELLAAASSAGSRSGRPPAEARKLVGLTFDDGYADFLHYALPALRRRGFSATLFAIAGWLGAENSWDAEGPRKALLTPEQLRRVAEAGIEIGSHGLTHVSLSSVTDAALADETVRSRRMLQELTGQEVAGFCYPYGDIDRRAFEYVRGAGYRYACAIWPSPLTGRHALPRTYVGDADYPLRMRAKWIRHRLKWGLPGAMARAGKTSPRPQGPHGNEPVVGHSA